MPIDFENSKFLKLAPSSVEKQEWLIELLIPNEKGLLAFLGVRDSIVFTNGRVMLRNVKGVTGTEVSVTSFPYNRINAFCIESSGITGISVSVTLYVSYISPIILEFTREANTKILNDLLSRAILAK